MSNSDLEKRVNQIEKDIQSITFSLKELLTWKRNQATRTLPEKYIKKPKQS